MAQRLARLSQLLISNSNLHRSFTLPYTNPKVGNWLSIRCIHVAGVEIPLDKRLEYSLQSIRGIGRSNAKQILSQLSFENKITRDLSWREVAILEDQVSNYVTGEELKRFNDHAIKRLMDITCYRGTRHIDGLPCRGQKTKNNCRTLKSKRPSGAGKKVAIAGKKKKK